MIARRSRPGCPQADIHARRGHGLPLLPSPPDATDRHREEQQRPQDRRDPRRQPLRGEVLQGALLHLVGLRRRAPHDRAQGPRAEPRLPRGLLELAGDRPARPDRRRADQGADRQERRQGDQEGGQGGRRAGDRHRLRPRGRADRPRGAGGDARGQPVAGHPRGGRRRHPADQARPLLGADQGGDRAGLLRARRALLPARQRRRRAPVHRPALGRHPDPRRLPGDPPLRLQLPLGGPGPEPDPGPPGRARDGAPRPRRQALLGGLRQVLGAGGLLRGAPRDRQVLGALRGRRRPRRDLEPGPGEIGRPRAATPASRRPPTTPPPSPPTPPAASASPRPPRCGSPRTSTWTASSPTRGPTTPSIPPRCRSASWSPRWCGSRTSRPPPACSTRRPAHPDPGQEGDHRPPADLPHPGGLPQRPGGPEAPRLRAGRAALPRHLLRADDHRVHAGRHRRRLADLLRPRLGRGRARLRRHLHLRPLLRRGDPAALRGRRAGARRRALDRRQGDPAALPLLAGQAGRADGGARPRHQGDPRRHHPEAL